MSKYVTAYNTGAFAKLLAALGIPGNTMTATIDMSAGQLVTLTLTRPLTEDEITAVSEVFITEGLEFVPTGDITYNLERRDDPD